MSIPKGTNPDIQLELNELRTQKQTVGHRFFSAAPIAADVPEMGFVLANVAGSFRIYTKINGVLKYAVLT